MDDGEDACAAVECSNKKKLTHFTDEDKLRGMMEEAGNKEVNRWCTFACRYWK